MAKKPESDADYDEKEALERMNKALKKAMETKPTPHKEMVKTKKGTKRTKAAGKK